MTVPKPSPLPRLPRGLPRALLSDEIRRELQSVPRPPLWLPLLVASAAGVVVAAVLAVAAWGSLPARIPSHFTLDGRADGWGSKWTLLVFPVMALVLFVMMTLVARFPAILNYPFRLTVENTRRQATLALLLIAWMRMATIWLMVYLEAGAVAAAGGSALHLGPLSVPVLLIWIAGPIGAYFALAWRWR